jgi:hypothetical protein
MRGMVALTHVCPVWVVSEVTRMGGRPATGMSLVRRYDSDAGSRSSLSHHWVG